MEKQLKDMKKEEIDVLIKEYYEKHRQMWDEINLILLSWDAEVLNEYVKSAAIDVPFDLKDTRVFDFFRRQTIAGTDTADAIKIEALNELPRLCPEDFSLSEHCFPCDFSSRYCTKDARCKYSCFLLAGGLICNDRNHPYAKFEHCIGLVHAFWEIAVKEHNGFCSLPDHPVMELHKYLADSAYWADQIMRLPLREFDYDDLQFLDEKSKLM